jgi:hypothetical protein
MQQTALGAAPEHPRNGSRTEIVALPTRQTAAQFWICQNGCQSSFGTDRMTQARAAFVGAGVRVNEYR